MGIFNNIINVFTISFDQFNADLLIKSIYIYINKILLFSNFPLCTLSHIYITLNASLAT